MIRVALLAILFASASCATVQSTFSTAHRDSLAARASADLACPKEQLKIDDAGNDSWTAAGCGKTGAYKLHNPNCLVERDCNWDAQPAATPPH